MCTSSALVLGVLVFSTFPLTMTTPVAVGVGGDASPVLLTARPSGSNSTSCVYNATASGNWNDPGTWGSAPIAPFPNTLPAGCTVNIPSGTTVTVPDGLSVVIFGSVQNGASLVINEFASITFRDNGTMNNNVRGSVSTSVGSAIDNEGGEINNNVGAQIALADSATFYNRAGSDVNNAGTIAVQSGAEFQVQGGQVRNSGSISDKGSIEDFPSGTISNLAGGTITVERVVYNAGTIDNSGSIENLGVIDNNGTQDEFRASLRELWLQIESKQIEEEVPDEGVPDD